MRSRPRKELLPGDAGCVEEFPGEEAADGHEDHPGYPAMAAALDRLFNEYEKAGTVRLTYDVKLYLGKARR